MLWPLVAVLSDDCVSRFSSLARVTAFDEKLSIIVHTAIHSDLSTNGGRFGTASGLDCLLYVISALS